MTGCSHAEDDRVATIIQEMVGQTIVAHHRFTLYSAAREKGGRLGHLAAIVARPLEGAAQRTDRALVEGAGGHILVLVVVTAGDAGHDTPALVVAVGRGARGIIFTLRRDRDDGRQDEGEAERDEAGKRVAVGTEGIEEGGDRHDRGHDHRTEADGIEVVEVGALELDIGGAELQQRLVDDEIGDDRADPGDGDV
jgi:hypothetical protein